jgi:multiple sugar transport system ATP-binding protein
VPEGELFCVVGPSGCGKTMLLRLVARLEKPSRAGVFSDGAEITHLRPVERDVAMVCQDAFLYPHMSAAENSAFSLRCSRTEDEETHRRVAETAEEVSSRLVGMLHRRPEQLSVGFR